MCGVWGFVKDKAESLSLAEEKYIRNCALAGQVRGEDGFGIMVMYENGTCKAYKGIATPNEIMSTEAYFDLFFEVKNQGKKRVAVWKKIKAVFGHNRAATKGKVAAKNCHPFRSGHIALMHNGTLTNTLPTGFDVDSEWVTNLLKETEDIQDVLDKVNGAYVFIWHNNKDKKLRIVSNGQRPLSYIQDYSTRFYASEREMLEWIFKRVHTNHTYKAGTVFPTHTIVEHDMLSKEVKEVPVKKTTTTTKTGTFTNIYSGQYNKRLGHGSNNSNVYTQSAVRSQSTNTSLEKARGLFFYKCAFPNTVSFKLRYDPYWSKLPNGERIFMASGDNQNLKECRNVLVASKLEIQLLTGVSYFASVLGYTHRHGNRWLLIDPNSIIVSESRSNKLVDATGKLISEEDYTKKMKCLCCNTPVERHELKRSYMTQDGLICEDCAPSFIPQLDSSDSPSNVHSLR